VHIENLEWANFTKHYPNFSTENGEDIKRIISGDVLDTPDYSFSTLTTSEGILIGIYSVALVMAFAATYFNIIAKK